MRLHCCKRVSQPSLQLGTGLGEAGEAEVSGGGGGGGFWGEGVGSTGTVPGAEIWNGCFPTAPNSAMCRTDGGKKSSITGTSCLSGPDPHVKQSAVLV